MAEEASKEQAAPEHKTAGGGSKTGLIIGLVVLLVVVLVGIYLFIQYAPTLGQEAGISDQIPVTEPVDYESAKDKVLTEVLKPADTESVVSMCKEPLAAGDVVVPQGGVDTTEKPITGETYFAFIDDDPRAMWSHDARYVYIDAATGEITTVHATWPPVINDKTMEELVDEGDCTLEQTTVA